MANSSKKKHQKQVERRRRLAEKQRQVDVLRRLAEKKLRYPEISFTGSADPGFEKLIRAAAAEIDFDDRTSFQKFERSTYRLMREFGAAFACRILAESALRLEEDNNPLARMMSIHFSVNLGQQIFFRAGEGLEKYLPVNDVRFHYEGNKIIGEFRQMKTHRLLGGTVYYSPRLPKIDVDGQMKIIGFSRHSIERICERLNPRWRTYAALGDVFAVFDRCARFDYCKLYRDQPAFTFYDLCDDDRFVNHVYVTDVLGKERLDPEAGLPYYRVGYCPAVVETIFFKAKTFLLPGYSTTPEAQLVRAASLSKEEKRRMLELAAKMSSTGLIDGDETKLLRWFHDNGVPQVIQSLRPIFPSYAEEEPRKKRKWTRLSVNYSELSTSRHLEGGFDFDFEQLENQ